MIGDLIIDTLDAYTTYGVYITDLSGVIGWPGLKELDQNDWPEEDGIEVDLTNPVLDTREFSLSLAANGTFANVGAFLEALSDGAYHTFAFGQLGITRSLRLASQPNYRELRKLKLFSLSFADDFPLHDYTYLAPKNLGVQANGYLLDSVDLSAYGVIVTDGTLEAIRKAPAVKQNLLVNVSNKAGATYEGDAVVFQPKEVPINCFLRTATIEDFWQNYNALLYNLTKANQRLLYVTSMEREFPCYYKSAAVNKFRLAGGRVWCDFTITLFFFFFQSGSE